MTLGSLQFLRLRFDRFEVDEADARLTNAGQPVPLPPKPFAVLCSLARTPGILVTKNALLDSVWGHRFVTDSVLKSTISDLRAVLGDDPKQPRFIETVLRRGYRFIAPLEAPVTQRTSTTPCNGPCPAALVELMRAVAPTWRVQPPWLSTPAEREALRRELRSARRNRPTSRCHRRSPKRALARPRDSR